MFQSIRNAGRFRDLNSARKYQLRPKIPNVGSPRAPTSAMNTSLAPNSTSAFSGAPAQPLSAAEIISKYYLQENVTVSTFINAGTDLLILTHKGIDDERVLHCVERLNADVIDDYIKQQVFLCATENFSRVHGAKRTSLFRELISRHTGKFDACESFLPSDAVMWSDSYIKALASTPSVSTSGEKVGSYLEAHLNQLVNSIAATPKWFDNVETVRHNLLRILSHRVVRTPSMLSNK